MVKNLSAVQETQVQSLGQEDLLEKEWLPTPVFLPGKFWTEASGGLQSMGLQRVGHDWCDLAPMIITLNSLLGWLIFYTFNSSLGVLSSFIVWNAYICVYIYIYTHIYLSRLILCVYFCVLSYVSWSWSSGSVGDVWWSLEEHFPFVIRAKCCRGASYVACIGAFIVG